MELKPCKYRKEHEWAEDGLCNHCFVAKPKEKAPEPVSETANIANIPVSLGQYFFQLPTSPDWFTFQSTGANSGTITLPAVGPGNAQQSAAQQNQQAGLGGFLGPPSGQHKLMPLQQLSVIQALQAGGFQLNEAMQAQLVELNRQLHPFTLEGQREQERQEAWATMRRQAMERCKHSLDTDEEHPDDYQWCRECRNWIDPHGE
jgi:hypothetical protein